MSQIIVDMKTTTEDPDAWTLIDNDTRNNSGQNDVAHKAQPSESTTIFDHCDEAYRCR